ncbi:MAG: hypothetical protein O9340_13945 [Cyclobacteriaceae bacterium]|jgi:hypothetical protein|nr:hypothetical protein [Cyclobacteriaceae bacterium]
MPKTNNIVHEYYKKQFEDFTIIVRLNPIHHAGTELTIPKQGEVSWRDLTFDEEIKEDLAADGFELCNPFEFNLYAAGLMNMKE